MQGTSTVIDAMHPWKHESEFSGFMEEGEIFTGGTQRAPIADPQRDLHVVSHVCKSLYPLRDHFQGKDEELRRLEELVDFVQRLSERVPVHSAEEQFELLHPLRTWLFFLPIDFLRKGQQDASVMVLLAHFYGVALAVEPLFPAVGAAYFGTMSVGPIEHIHRTLVKRMPSALALMTFPLEMVSHFRQRMDWRRAQAGSHAAGGVGGVRAAAAAAAAAAAEEEEQGQHHAHHHPHHLRGGWNFDAFPEYAMVGGGLAQRVSPVPTSPSAVQDVRGSGAASDFIASAMWRVGP